MLVYINHPNHFISPIELAEKLFHIDYNSDIRLHRILSNICIPLVNIYSFLLRIFHPQITYVHTSYADTWNLDHTLGTVILASLRHFRTTCYGAPAVDLSDIPSDLQTSEYTIHDHWDFILDEMIFAFEHHINHKWEDDCCTGTYDLYWQPIDKDGLPVEKGQHTAYSLEHGPNHTVEYDTAALALMSRRIQNGFRLFGRYYQALWN